MLHATRLQFFKLLPSNYSKSLFNFILNLVDFIAVIVVVFMFYVFFFFQPSFFSIAYCLHFLCYCRQGLNKELNFQEHFLIAQVRWYVNSHGQQLAYLHSIAINDNEILLRVMDKDNKYNNNDHDNFNNDVNCRIKLI